MSILAYIWQTIMRKTHFGSTFFRFFTFGTAIHKRNITGQNTLYFPANGQTKTYDVG